MCTKCDVDQTRKIKFDHPQMVAEPQPEYRGPGPQFSGTGDVVTVDEELHDLLQALWAKGFHTQFSCQGGDDEKAYILFETVNDGIRFFRETAKRASKKMHTPKLYLETSLGLAPDFSSLGPAYPSRCTVRWSHGDMAGVKAAWL